MSQTRLHSLIEVICNIATGMIIAWSVTQFIAVPFIGITITMEQNIYLTIVLTAVSVVRSYIWRRIFNKMKN